MFVLTLQRQLLEFRTEPVTQGPKFHLELCNGVKASCDVLQSLCCLALICKIQQQ